MKLKRLKRDIEYYDRALLKLRKGQTFFLNASSFANVEILTIDYLKRLYNGTLELHEFKKSVVGMRPGLRRDLRFYVLFGEGHKYYNGTMSGEAAYSLRELRYLHHDKTIEGGMDFGNMLSLVIGQPDGAYYRVHKNFLRYRRAGSGRSPTSSSLSSRTTNIKNWICTMTVQVITLRNRRRITRVRSKTP